MSHVYYTSGERDLETGEYELPEIEDDEFYWRPNSSETKEKRYTIPLPKQFTSYYYSDKLSKLNRESRDYWDIKYLSRYSYAVCEFYIKVVKEFADVFACPHVVDGWANERTISSDLQTLADNLIKAESNLTNQFTKFGDRSVGTFLNRSETIRALRDYGAKAWIMYNALNNEIHINYAKKFTDACNGYDLYHSHHDQVMAYRGSKIMLREMKLLKKNNFMCSSKYKHGNVYSKFEASSVYDSLMSEMNIHTSADYDKIEREMYPVLSEHAKEDSDIRDIFFFYNKYDAIKDLIYNIRCINNNIEESDTMFLFAYNDSRDGDLFVLAYRYSLFLDHLLTIVEDPLIIKDVKKLLDRLNNLIVETKPHYEKCHLVKDSNFLEKYSSIEIK